MALTDFNTKVDRILQDEAEILSSANIDSFILVALNFHNKIKPKKVIADIAGDGNYDLALPVTHIDGLSIISSVEYPAGERYPVYLEPKDWIIYKTISTTKLRLLNHTPATGETVRLALTTPYTESNIDDIPANNQEPFCYLASALAAKSLAMYYAQSTDGSVDADTVDYEELSDKYAARAKELKGTYDTFFGVKDGVTAAMGLVDWDTNFSWGEEQFTKPDHSN